MKEILIKVLIIIFMFIALTFVSVFFLMNSSSVLVSFGIKNVSNIYNTFELTFDKVKAAKYYRVELNDQESNLIYFFNTEDTYNKFYVDNLIYNTTYSLMVYAYDKDGNSMPAREAYQFTYLSPTIDRTDILLNDKDYLLKINGKIEDKEYYINISKNNEILKNERITSNEYNISKDYYINESVELNVEIICDGIIVDKVSLYNNMNPIKDIYIETPTNDTSIIYNDVVLIFSGGENAKSYIINIYKGKNLIHTSTANKKRVIISRSFFESENKYRVEVIGTYDEYTNKSEVTFDITGRAKLQPVYINHNPKAIKKGTMIELKQSENANIYYTLNGDDPLTNGILYTSPIEINESCVLKTVASYTLRENSVVTTYDLNVTDKTNYKIYISPSNQGGNPGVHEVGFTNEKQEMNKIADYLIEKLKEYDNVIVYRNNPEGNINQWNNDANYLGVDFKFAIHSNASVDHTSYGVETWVNSENSETFSIASLMQDKITNMYPYKEREGYNRGVKYALGEIGEANDDYIKFGILIEVAHHDDYQDAKWMKENEKEIGYAMAEVILKYFQIV